MRNRQKNSSSKGQKIFCLFFASFLFTMYMISIIVIYKVNKKIGGFNVRFEGVYKITCIPNGKAYIGQSENVLKRWKSHFYEANKNKHINKELQEDINKYGITNFTFEILSNSIEDELFFIEKFKDSVKLYNSLLEKRRDLKELKNGSNLSKNERDAEIIKLKKEGFKVSEIAKVLSITDTTIYNVLKINSLKNGL